MTCMKWPAQWLKRARSALWPAVLSPALLAGTSAWAGEAGQGFHFELALSDKAQASLAARRETVTVLASYSGAPNRQGQAHVDELGMVDVGKEVLEIAPRPGTVRITGKGVDPAKLKWVQGGVNVNVNLYTSRKSGDENLIDCDFIDGDLGQVQAAHMTLRCVLLGEPFDGRRYP